MTQQLALDQAAILARFMEKVRVDPDTGCWEWRGTYTGKRYPYFFRPQGSKRAHRFSFESFIGPIPPDRVLDHLCRRRMCVNPWHLEVVTNWDNLLRGENTPAHKALQVCCLHGHPFNSLNTRVRRNGSRCCRTCERIRNRFYRTAVSRHPGLPAIPSREAVTA